MLLSKKNLVTKKCSINITDVWLSFSYYLLNKYSKVGEDFGKCQNNIVNDNKKLWIEFCESCYESTKHWEFGSIRKEQDVLNELTETGYTKESFLQTCLFKKENLLHLKTY